MAPARALHPGRAGGTAGVYWDLGWHYDRGRDTVLSAPHLLIGLGSMVLGLAVALWSLLVHRRAKAGGEVVLPLRDHAGITYSPLLLVALIAAMVPPVALSIDEVWHQLFGLDTSLWSPTHLLAIIAGPVAMIAVSALVVWEMNQTDPERSRPELRPLRGVGLPGVLAVATFAAVAVTLLLPWAEYDFDLPQWDLALAPPLLVAMLAFPTFLAVEAVGRRWTATLVLASVAILRLLITAFVLAADQTAPDIVVPVLAGAALDLIVIAGAGALRGRTLAVALVAFPIAVIGSEAARLMALGQEKWLEGLFPFGGGAALAAGVAAGYLGTAAGRWMRPASDPRPRSARACGRRASCPAPAPVCRPPCSAHWFSRPARPEPSEPRRRRSTRRSWSRPRWSRARRTSRRRARDGARHRVRGCPPRQPEGADRRGGQANRLAGAVPGEQRREPQLTAYYGGTWVREPLHRIRPGVFEAKVTFPHDGHWRMGPFFYLGDFRWTERVSFDVAEPGAAPSGLAARRFPLELAAEGDPVDAPTWLKPIGFALLGALFLAAIWLVVVQLRIVRQGGIVSARPARLVYATPCSSAPAA